MKEVLQIVESSSVKMRERKEGSYNNKLRRNDIEVGDPMVLRKFEKGGTGNLRSYWANNPVFQCFHIPGRGKR